MVVGTLADGTVCFAPLGELLVVDGGQRVVCHLCGRELVLLAASHLRKHGWTPQAYREAFGLGRGTALCAPLLLQQRRALGVARYAANARLRDGLAVGQAMARSGELLERSHAAQPVGGARAQTRRQAAARTAPQRQRAAEVARLRVQGRLAELGFPGDLNGYLQQRYTRERLPVLAVARELGVGNARIQQLLDAAGIQRRRPGGAAPARGRRARDSPDAGQPAYGPDRP